MNVKIENKFNEIHMTFIKLVGVQQAVFWLKNVEKTLLDLQHNNIGRLTPSRKPIWNYLPISEWLLFLEIESIEQGISEKKPILSHILGVFHALADGALKDKHHGVVDCIFLGVIPTVLNNTILNSLNEAINADPSHHKIRPLDADIREL